MVDISADIDHTADRLVASKFANSGQTCIAPDYALVPDSMVDNLTETLIVKIRQFFGEKPNGSDEMGKVINEFHTKRIAKLLEGCGGKVLLGGKVDVKNKYIEPTIILNPNKDSDLMTEEIFGPIFPVFTYSNFN